MRSTAYSFQSSSAVAATVTSSSPENGVGAPARRCSETRFPPSFEPATTARRSELAIVENLQRENLNPLEEAAGFQYLIDEHALTQEEVARRLGKSRPAVANAMRLLGLSETIKAMLVGGELSAGHGRALLAAPEAQRVTLARRAVNEGLTVRSLERLANGDTRTPERDRPVPRGLSADEEDFERRLRERFGTHVALVRTGRGGRIELRFQNDGDLVRLGDLLLRTEP